MERNKLEHQLKVMLALIDNAAFNDEPLTHGSITWARNVWAMLEQNEQAVDLGEWAKWR